jgi:hypothetical protein
MRMYVSMSFFFLKFPSPIKVLLASGYFISTAYRRHFIVLWLR